MPPGLNILQKDTPGNYIGQGEFALLLSRSSQQAQPLQMQMAVSPVPGVYCPELPLVTSSAFFASEQHRPCHDGMCEAYPDSTGTLCLWLRNLYPAGHLQYNSLSTMQHGLNGEPRPRAFICHSFVGTAFVWLLLSFRGTADVPSLALFLGWLYHVSLSLPLAVCHCRRPMPVTAAAFAQSSQNVVLPSAAVVAAANAEATDEQYGPALKRVSSAHKSGTCKLRAKRDLVEAWSTPNQQVQQTQSAAQVQSELHRVASS